MDELPKIWNATEDEIAARYPCDELAFAHDEVFFRAIDIAAPPALVFRWLCQLRVAPYSYDLLDNFARRSPPHLTPGLDDLRSGQRMMHLFELVAFERDASLTIVQHPRSPMRAFADFAGTYRVTSARAPVGADESVASRLVAKVLARGPRGPLAAPLRAALPWIDYVMFRKQLETLKVYCERDAMPSREAPRATLRRRRS